MSCWMKRKYSGNKDRGFNGWERETIIQSIFITMPPREEGRTLSVGYGMRKGYGVIIEKALP